MSDDPTGPIRLSVLIATRQRRDVLAMCLSKYAEQTFREFEIIVVDNGSTDGTDEMMRREFQHVRYVRLAENQGPEALNLAARMAKGDLLWRTDDDAHPSSPDTLRDVVDMMDQHPEIGVVTGEIFQHTTQSFEAYEPNWPDMKSVPPNGVDTASFCGCAVCFRREVFFAAGGFWDTFYLEEEDLSLRIRLKGFSIRYVPRIQITHYSQATPKTDPTRWVVMTTQLVRFQYKYYGLLRATMRTMVVLPSQLILAIWHRIPVRIVGRTFAQSLTLARIARKHERIPLTMSQRRRLLGHDGILGQTFRYYGKAIRRKWRLAVTDTKIHESSKNQEEHHGTH